MPPSRNPSGTWPGPPSGGAAAILLAWALVSGAGPHPAARADDAGSRAEATARTRERIENRLMCYCGCADLTVRVCNCGTAAQIRDDIDARLGRGDSPDRIVAAYVERYGEQILSAPTTRGFNLLAWVMPFAALLVATSFVVALIRRWSSRPEATVPATGPASPRGGAAGGPQSSAAGRRAEPADSTALRERVEREIRDGL